VTVPRRDVVRQDEDGLRGGSLVRAVEALGKGSLVIMPTDTVYGVAADPAVPGAVERIFAAKGRDRDKPIPLLAAGIEDVRKYGAVLGRAERELASRYWPGPLTMVLKVGDREEGFRVPDHGVALALLREAGGVLRVTSANISGAPPALTAEAAATALGDRVEEVLDAGHVPGGKPSTVVRATGERIEILREGAIPSRDILEAASGIGGECPTT